MSQQPTDDELDAVKTELEAAKSACAPDPAVRGVGAAPAAAVDPAVLVTIIETVLKLIEWFRSRR